MNIILGPPGTGKTTKLLSLVEEYLAKGVPAKEIGFLAFTRKAADEAKTRAKEKFKFTDTDLTFFRTIHSLCFRQLALSKTQVMQKHNYVELGEILGIEINCYVDMEDGELSPGTGYGDQLIFIDNLARVKMVSLEQEYNSGTYDIDWQGLLLLSKTLTKYKEANALVDFTDMLELFIRQGVIPELKVLFIDEAQDLSALQWKAIEAIIRKTKEVYICGDDDQSIFRWAGADTDYFVTLPGAVQTLDKSFRVPLSVQTCANELIMQVKSRRSKMWSPRSNEGTLTWHNNLDSVPFDSGNWLLLARNTFLLKQLENLCLQNGFSFEGKWSPLKSPTLKVIRLWEQLRSGEKTIDQVTMSESKKMQPYTSTYDVTRPGPHWPIWHVALDKMSPYEREYFIAARRRGEALWRKPRIKISTIHGAKGGEADNVLLLTDMAYKTYQEMQNNWEDEARVFYVGVTRAKENLHIIAPRTNLYFEL